MYDVNNRTKSKILFIFYTIHKMYNKYNIFWNTNSVSFFVLKLNISLVTKRIVKKFQFQSATIILRLGVNA